MAKMTKMARRKAALKAWKKRRAKYGKDGLSAKGKKAVQRAAKKRRK